MLGKGLRHRRVARLLTLSELATASGVSVKDLLQIETGELIPSAGTLRKLAKSLGLGGDKLSPLDTYTFTHPRRVRQKLLTRMMT